MIDWRAMLIGGGLLIVAIAILAWWMTMGKAKSDARKAAKQMKEVKSE